jgi:hypothetical protein
MQREILIEHLKYVDDYYEFSDKSSEKDRNFMLDNGYVLQYDEHIVISKLGEELLKNNYKNTLCNIDLDDEDIESFNIMDEEYLW